jgi:hypothetical protein
MAEVQPDPTDTGTLRPKRKPLQKCDSAFILIDVPEFLSEVLLLTGIILLNALDIFNIFLPDRMLKIIVEATNNTEGRAHGPWKPNARALNWTLLT